METGVLDVLLYNQIQLRHKDKKESRHKKRENVHLAFVSDKEKMLRYVFEEISSLGISSLFSSEF